MSVAQTWKTLRISVNRRLSARRGRINPWRDWATSAVVLAIGIGVGPLIANRVFDVTKSYVLVMWGAIPALVLAALVVLVELVLVLDPDVLVVALDPVVVVEEDDTEVTMILL